jgi:hypothetical protein
MGFGGLLASSEFSTVASNPTCANSLSCPNCPKNVVVQVATRQTCNCRNFIWGTSLLDPEVVSPTRLHIEACGPSVVFQELLPVGFTSFLLCVCVVSLSFYICASTKHTPCSCKTWSLQTKALQHVVSLYILLPEEMPNIYIYTQNIYIYYELGSATWGCIWKNPVSPNRICDLAACFVLQDPCVPRTIQWLSTATSSTPEWLQGVA